MRGRSADDEEFLQATLGHADLVHALARRLAPHPQDAADLVQETYLRAYAGWRRRRPTDVRAWLATICLNVGRDELRRHGRRSAVLSDAALPERADETDTAQAALARIDADRVRAALWTLPEAQRIAITLMDLCGFTAAHVARITDAPRGTVLARVHRGRKLLALRLDQDSGIADSGEVANEPRS